jgi:hypothetical protein
MAARKDFELFFRPPHLTDFLSVTMFGGAYNDASARKWAKNCFPKGVELYTSLNAERETV